VVVVAAEAARVGLVAGEEQANRKVQVHCTRALASRQKGEIAIGRPWYLLQQEVVVLEWVEVVVVVVVAVLEE